MIQRIVEILHGLLSGVDGSKSYLAAVGLLGLGIYQFTQGQHQLAIETVLAALGLFGLRHAVEKKQ